MEHRLSQRVEGGLPILVYKRRMPVATGMIRDASRRGMFIATDYADVRLNQTIELAFRFPERTDQGHYTLSAHIVRTDDSGLGVDFDGIENNALIISELIAFLQQQSSTAFAAGYRRRQMS
ncbi:PilZ domain-containing protein [Marinobacter daepoensis]|uniref:PilZ domain-containing protein n=1 Tax=Marinobacter daepoensis TaxID=262077 RepID=A0ABS3BBR6_9GAMM|nr:PilZ domain-containing protein [Marinobacter daepoensis]MBN7769064.1 PilZ domain-containing protein [Marinobacter daepoensis]MBY6077754.1 PilZ domain-containing protein [Marinobacter daepoensis]